MHEFAGGGTSKSISQKNPISASSGVSNMVLRNVSEELVRNVAEHVSSELVCNVAGFVSELVRNVSGQLVSNVGGFRVRVRNVSVSGSGMVPDVGRLLPDVGGQSTNFMSL